MEFIEKHAQSYQRSYNLFMDILLSFLFLLDTLAKNSFSFPFILPILKNLNIDFNIDNLLRELKIKSIECLDKLEDFIWHLIYSCITLSECLCFILMAEIQNTLNMKISQNRKIFIVFI